MTSLLCAASMALGAQARGTRVGHRATAPALPQLGHRAAAPALPQLGHPCPRHALAMPSLARTWRCGAGRVARPRTAYDCLRFSCLAARFSFSDLAGFFISVFFASIPLLMRLSSSGLAPLRRSWLPGAA